MKRLDEIPSVEPMPNTTEVKKLYCHRCGKRCWSIKKRCRKCGSRSYDLVIERWVKPPKTPEVVTLEFNINKYSFNWLKEMP